MDWQCQLISIYLTVTSYWNKGVSETVRRHSNHRNFALTDEEVITIYLFGIISGNSSVRTIYDYSKRHLQPWFPNLATYEAFSYRLNKISDGFVRLSQELVKSSKTELLHTWVIDSLPIVLAGPRRSGRAKVAADMASKGYCASKDLYFYGVKLHCVGTIQLNTIPVPSYVGLAPAHVNDQSMFELMSHELADGRIYADMAYCDSEHTGHLASHQNVEVLTPIKKKKGLHSFPGSDIISSSISSIRQPIESFFNWLQEKTKIQHASKVRSSAGLTVHVFGRLAAAVLLQVGFNP